MGFCKPNVSRYHRCLTFFAPRGIFRLCIDGYEHPINVEAKRIERLEINVSLWNAHSCFTTKCMNRQPTNAFEYSYREGQHLDSRCDSCECIPMLPGTSSRIRRLLTILNLFSASFPMSIELL